MVGPVLTVLVQRLWAPIAEPCATPRRRHCRMIILGEHHEITKVEGWRAGIEGQPIGVYPKTDLYIAKEVVVRRCPTVGGL